MPRILVRTVTSPSVLNPSVQLVVTQPYELLANTCSGNVPTAITFDSIVAAPAGAIQVLGDQAIAVPSTPEIVTVTGTIGISSANTLACPSAIAYEAAAFFTGANGVPIVLTTGNGVLNGLSNELTLTQFAAPLSSGTIQLAFCLDNDNPCLTIVNTARLYVTFSAAS